AGSWLGAGAIVLPGSCIGRHVVVGAGSVVRGQVPDHCVVAGVPARIIRSYVAGDGWRPMRDGVPTGTLADAEGVQGVPEPPHPVL
ncbi:MAG TPA: acyltransferase, partial [Streptosporangiaceae bacterium]